MNYQKNYLIIKDPRKTHKICGQVLIEKDKFACYSVRINMSFQYVLVLIFYENNLIHKHKFYSDFVAKKLNLHHDFDTGKLGFLFCLDNEKILFCGSVNQNYFRQMELNVLSSPQYALTQKIVHDIFSSERESFYSFIQKKLISFMGEAVRVTLFDNIFPSSEFFYGESDGVGYVIGLLFHNIKELFCICMGKVNPLYKNVAQNYSFEFYDCMTGENIDFTRVRTYYI